MTAEQLRERARDLVAGWPALSDEQLVELRRLIPRRAR